MRKLTRNILLASGFLGGILTGNLIPKLDIDYRKIIDTTTPVFYYDASAERFIGKMENSVISNYSWDVFFNRYRRFSLTFRKIEKQIGDEQYSGFVDSNGNLRSLTGRVIAGFENSHDVSRYLIPK
ncbi:MAG: hypothetical protein ABIH49_00780 [archaeon]